MHETDKAEIKVRKPRGSREIAAKRVFTQSYSVIRALIFSAFDESYIYFVIHHCKGSMDSNSLSTQAVRSPRLFPDLM